MTQEDYKLWTGETVNYSGADWGRLVAVASGRLASFLCLDALPTNEDGSLPDELSDLLANFICAVLKRQGDHAEITSKRVRNFTISFGSTGSGSAFEKIAGQYGDVIEQYSECALGFTVEKSTGGCCGRF